MIDMSHPGWALQLTTGGVARSPLENTCGVRSFERPVCGLDTRSRYQELLDPNTYQRRLVDPFFPPQPTGNVNVDWVNRELFDRARDSAANFDAGPQCHWAGLKIP